MNAANFDYASFFLFQRERCVPLLRQLINCFRAVGRHRLYRNLLRLVTHAGVRGLLVHDVKNEVDRALKVHVRRSRQL